MGLRQLASFLASGPANADAAGYDQLGDILVNPSAEEIRRLIVESDESRPAADR